MPYKLREARLVYGNKYREKNKARLCKYHKWLRDNKPDYTRNRKLKSSYGLSLEDYNKLLKKQNGLCRVCLKAETMMLNNRLKYLVVDHDHKTGKVRGLLCSNCNVALGLLKDDPKLVKRLLNYVTKAKNL